MAGFLPGLVHCECLCCPHICCCESKMADFMADREWALLRPEAKICCAICGETDEWRLGIFASKIDDATVSKYIVPYYNDRIIKYSRPPTLSATEHISAEILCLSRCNGDLAAFEAICDASYWCNYVYFDSDRERDGYNPYRYRGVTVYSKARQHAIKIKDGEYPAPDVSFPDTDVIYDWSHPES